MQFLRQHKFVLSFLVLLVFCSVMVILQMDARKSKHVELREAMILLETGGYTNEADRLYLRLFAEMPQLSNKALIEDWQRTVILVDPGGYQPSNAVWRYTTGRCATKWSGVPRTPSNAPASWPRKASEAGPNGNGR